MNPFGENVGWLQAQLARYTYRPNVTMEIRHDQYLHGAAVLIVTMRVPDSRHVPAGQAPTIKVGRRVQVPPRLGEDEFGRWLARQLEEAEIHESQEWLRRDGEILNNPHARDLPTPARPAQIVEAAGPPIRIRSL